MRVCFPRRAIAIIGLIAPRHPTLAGATGEEFEIGRWATRLDDFILLVGLARMLALVARKPLVLGRDLPGLVGELPRRIGKDGAEAAFADELEQVASNGIHKMHLAVERISRARNTACDSGNTKRSWSRFQLHIKNLHMLERPACDCRTC